MTKKLEGYDIPEVGKTYIDTMPDSETYGEKFECIADKPLIRTSDRWSGPAFRMKHLITGKVGGYQSFD